MKTSAINGFGVGVGEGPQAVQMGPGAGLGQTHVWRVGEEVLPASTCPTSLFQASPHHPHPPRLRPLVVVMG